VAASKEIEKVNLNNEWKLREVDDIVGDIKTWKKLYHNEKKHPLTGFFLDNYPKHLKDSKGIEVRPKLIQLRDAIRKEFPGAVIVANPGTNVPDEYVENKVADALIGSETTLENGLQQMEKLPNWVGQDNKPEYGILFHHSPKNDKWKELFGKNAVPVTKLNFLYVEDTAAGKNEWTKLTSFWKEFVTEVGKLGR
jgi:hypothetical protein